MKILGLIIEYNPFHNGHQYHLKQALNLINPDVTIGILSGNFVQRGEPSVFRKQAKVNFSLEAGLDLVLELPLVFSIQDAGGFALGSVWTLDKLKASSLVFGSESNDLKSLKKIAFILNESSNKYTKLLKEFLKKGLSFPNSRKEALKVYFESSGFDPEIINKISLSNDILGLEYLKSILHLKSSINAFSIKRIGKNYHDLNPNSSFSSASAIRNLLKKGDLEKIKKLVPEFAYKIIINEINNNEGPIFLENLEKTIISIFRMNNLSDFEYIYGINEGLDVRFKKVASVSKNLESFLMGVKTKRFTLTRIKRALLSTLIKLENTSVKNSNIYGPQYIRVLGFNEKGRKYLSYLKKKIDIPVITNLSDWPRIYKKVLNNKYKVNPELFKTQLFYDIKATELYTLFNKEKNLLVGNEYKYNVKYKKT